MPGLRYPQIVKQRNVFFAGPGGEGVSAGVRAEETMVECVYFYFLWFFRGMFRKG